MKRKAKNPETLVLHTSDPVRSHPSMAVLNSEPNEAIPVQNRAAVVLGPFLRMLALKDLYRQGWLKRGIPENRCESVADHSFGTALLALILSGTDSFPGVDRDRAVRMALVHELCEVYAGDITPVDGISEADKQSMERESLGQVLDGLPGAQEYRELWEDFEEGRSPEARLLRQLDRLELGLQALVYQSEGFPRMQEFLDSADRAVRDPALRAILELAQDIPLTPKAVSPL